MPKKILIVDDEPSVIKILTEKLSKEGFAVAAARDGYEALSKVENEKPDLILLDIIMPRLDGISVLRKLKSSDTTKDIPVMILTNLYDDKKVEEVLKTGNTDYLVKLEHPINEVIRKVKEKLNL